MEKVLIWGDETRYRRDLPDFLGELELQPIFCPRSTPITTLLPQHSDASYLFVDAITPVTDQLM